MLTQRISHAAMTGTVQVPDLTNVVPFLMQGDRQTTHGGPYNTLAAPAVEAAGWPVLDVWNATVRRSILALFGDSQLPRLT